MLNRLDQALESRAAMQPLADDPSRHAWTTDFLARAGSQWQASVRLLENGMEQARTGFIFGFGGGGLSEGHQMPLVHPLTLIALLLGGVAVPMLTLGLAGGVPPRTHAPTARRALIVGGLVAGGLAAAAPLLPPPV